MTKQRSFAALCFLAILGLFFFNNCAGPKDNTYDSLPTQSVNSSSSTPTVIGGYEVSTSTPTTTKSGTVSYVSFYEGVRGDVVSGWVCIQKNETAVQVQIAVDNKILDTVTANLESPDVARIATSCGTIFTARRFLYRFSPADYAKYKGFRVTLTANNVATINVPTQSFPNSILGNELLWYNELPAGHGGTPSSYNNSPVLEGYWDSMANNTNGTVRLTGWACVVADSRFTQLVIRPTTSSEELGVMESRIGISGSEADIIKAACQDGSSLRRFEYLMPAAVASSYLFKKLRISLRDPFVPNKYYDDLKTVANLNTQILKATCQPSTTTACVLASNTGNGVRTCDSQGLGFSGDCKCIPNTTEKRACSINIRFGSVPGFLYCNSAGTSYDQCIRQ